MTGGRKKMDSHHRDGVVIENGRDIFRGELVCCVADEETSLSNGTVADDYAPRKQAQRVSSNAPVNGR